MRVVAEVVGVNGYKFIGVTNAKEDFVPYAFSINGVSDRVASYRIIKPRCRYCGKIQVQGKDYCDSFGGEYRNPVRK